MYFLKKIIDTIKYTIDDIKMMDFQNYMKKHADTYKKSIAEFHKNFYLRNIIRRTLITMPLFLFFPNIVTIIIAILGLTTSLREWKANIIPCIKYKKNKKIEQNQILTKTEKEHEESCKNITYKINDKEIPFEEISKEESESKIQFNNFSNTLTKTKNYNIYL